MVIFQKIAQEIKKQGFAVASFDFKRPWGGFFVIEEKQAQEFANIYFEDKDKDWSRSKTKYLGNK
jgi:mannose-6-phosphate isomerase